MKLKFSIILSVLALTGALSSCSSGTDPDTITRQSINNCFAYYTELSTGTSKAGSALGYEMEVNYTQSTCNFIITGLSLPNGKTYPAITLTGVPLKVENNNWLVFSGQYIQSSISGFSSAPGFESFKCRMLHRSIGDDYYPGFSVEFQVEGYHVFSSLTTQYFFGETTSRDDKGTSFKSESTSYCIELGTELTTAKLTMSGAQFIANMPAMNIELAALPITISGNRITMESSAITPAIGGTPFPAFPITDFKATVDLTAGMNLSFVCDPSTAEGVYTVTATTTLGGESTTGAN